MTPSTEVTAAREDVARARTQVSDTIDEITERFSSPVRTVRERLDVSQVIAKHPWIALGVALGAGALLATSGADQRAASAVVGKAKRAGAGTVRLAKEAPSKSRTALTAMVDSTAAKLALSLIGSLRDSLDRSKVEVRTGVRYEENTAPATGVMAQL